MDKFISMLAALKEHLAENKHAFVERNSWFGDTERGFTTVEEFDLDKLLAEIDKFGEELRGRNP